MDMKVILVVGYDSMLFNIGGVYNVYFICNIVVFIDNVGYIGVGEVLGGEVIYQMLVDVILMVLGQEVVCLNKVVQQVYKGNQVVDFDIFGKGVWMFELWVNVVVVLEVVLFDLLGQVFNVLVCELLGFGKQCDVVIVLGYFFYIGDCIKIDLLYLESMLGSYEWYCLCYQEVLNSDVVVWLVEVFQDCYGFKDFKFKGGVLLGE